MSKEIAEVIEEHGKAVSEFKTRAEGRLERIEGKLASVDSAIMELAQKAEGFRGMPHGKKTGPLDELKSSPELQAFAKNRSVKSVNVPINGSLVEIKAVVGDVAGSGNDLYNVEPQRDSRLANNPMRRLSVFDVLPRLQVSSNSFQYNALDQYTNAAAYQTQEGAEKAQGNLPTELVTAPIVTIAHYIKLSEQVLDDAPALTQQVSTLLRYGVLAKASAEIIAGATVGKIQGLATQATQHQVPGTMALADAIGSAATALDVEGWNADTVIIHPNDLFAIRSERTTDEGYVASGWVGGNEQTIWGLRAVSDPSVTEGEPLVLDSSQVAILDRMDARVEFGRSGDDMINNLVTALAEARLGLAVFSPSAVKIIGFGSE
ncbi:phage major capsid protein [Bordetella petrii]|uniref:phage major capsid protein n=1 Tax=Bordetella petrii TaxID=94624 RepID=UPI0004BB596A|nr:phage major capsid protein [Bordetella petrii]